MNAGDRKLYICDKPGFKRQHITNVQPKTLPATFVRESGILSGRAGPRKTIGEINGRNDSRTVTSSSNRKNWRMTNRNTETQWDGWINPKKNVSDRGILTSRGDYMVMAVRAKKNAEFCVAGAKHPIKINGQKTSVWIDSGLPITNFTIGELRKTIGAAGIKLQEVDPKDQELRDYGSNPIRLLGTMRVELVSNGWVTSASIRVIGVTRPSIIGRDLIAELGLHLVQKKSGHKVMSIQG